MNGKPRGNLDEVRTVGVSLPRLDPDTPDTCPVPLADVQEHVRIESDDGTVKSFPLTFLRTARIGATEYWIWRFHEPGRGDGYALVAFWPPKLRITECDDTFDMTPEQYILAAHFEIEP
jgi:hypothetical protein